MSIYISWLLGVTIVILADIICQLFFHPFISTVCIIIIIIIIIIILLLLLLYISIFWLPSIECLSVWLVPMFVLTYFILFISSLGRGLWLGCRDYWSQGGGGRLLAKRRLVLGTWPPLMTNVVNPSKKVVGLKPTSPPPPQSQWYPCDTAPSRGHNLTPCVTWGAFLRLQFSLPETYRFLCLSYKHTPNLQHKKRTWK